MDRKHEMSYSVTKTTWYAQWNKGAPSAPLSHGLPPVLTSLLESGVINHRDRAAFEHIIWFCLTGQLNQDVCPPNMFSSWFV